MFLGCSPCCGGSCPVNYYDLLDNAEEIEINATLRYYTGVGYQQNLNDNTNTFPASTTPIGRSKDHKIRGGSVNDLGGNILFLPSSKVKNNGVIYYRSYEPTGQAGPGVLKNYWQITATSYALTISCHIRESSCWHDYMVKEEKCLGPDVQWLNNLTRYPERYQNEAEWNSLFNTGRGDEYTTFPGQCQKLHFYNYSAYEFLPHYRIENNAYVMHPNWDSETFRSDPVYAYSLQDWSFIYYLDNHQDYQWWLDTARYSYGYPQNSTRWDGHYNYDPPDPSSTVLGFKGKTNVANAPGLPPLDAYTMKGMTCVRPYEKECFSDIYDTMQQREFWKDFYPAELTGFSGTPSNGFLFPSLPREYFALSAAWAWVGDTRHSLMQTQPAYGRPESAWQMCTYRPASTHSNSDTSFTEPIRNLFTNRRDVPYHYSPDPQQARYFISTSDVCSIMGEPYGW